jgi:hypothetical protein
VTDPPTSKDASTLEEDFILVLKVPLALYYDDQALKYVIEHRSNITGGDSDSGSIRERTDVCVKSDASFSLT